MGNPILYRGPASLGVMLSTDNIEGDRYASYFALPIDPASIVTERKQVHKHEGAMLEQFFAQPVHTSSDRAVAATHTLPQQIHHEMARYMAGAGRSNGGYALELVGTGADHVSWWLQRLVGRHELLYNRRGSLEGWDPEKLRQRAQQFQIAYWQRDVRFALLVAAFTDGKKMDAWTRNPTWPRQPPAHESPRMAWFESMGCINVPRLNLDDEARAFAEKRLSNWGYVKAYWNRGPSNPILSFFNWPILAYRLHWQSCPAGTVLTKFKSTVRLRIYQMG